MKAGYIFWCVAVLLAVALPGICYAADGNDDFDLRIVINGEDVTEKDTAVIDPDEALNIELMIFNGDRDITIQQISIAMTFASQTILSHIEPVGNYYIPAGKTDTIMLEADVRKFLKAGDRLITTGVYRSHIQMKYTVGGREESGSLWKNIKIPGNPLATPPGVAGAVVGAGALVSILALVRSIAIPGLPAGSVLPAGTAVKATSGLQKFIAEKLESQARGRVSGNIVKAAKKRIVKQKCPLCETRLKHGYCYTCKKSAKEVRKEYLDKLKDLSLRGGQIIASGEAASTDELCEILGINDRLGTDVIATLRHARLVKVKGIARKLTGKAVTTGISSGLSAIIWVTIGGFAALSMVALVAILAAAIIIPLVITISLQMKARREIKTAGANRVRDGS